MNIWNTMLEHWLITSAAVCFIAGVVLQWTSWVWNRFMRMLMVRKHGWPPAHLDADGDAASTENEGEQEEGVNAHALRVLLQSIGELHDIVRASDTRTSRAIMELRDAVLHLVRENASLRSRLSVGVSGSAGAALSAAGMTTADLRVYRTLMETQVRGGRVDAGEMTRSQATEAIIRQDMEAFAGATSTPETRGEIAQALTERLGRLRTTRETVDSMIGAGAFLGGADMAAGEGAVQALLSLRHSGAALGIAGGAGMPGPNRNGDAIRPGALRTRAVAAATTTGPQVQEPERRPVIPVSDAVGAAELNLGTDNTDDEPTTTEEITRSEGPELAPPGDETTTGASETPIGNRTERGSSDLPDHHT